MSNQKPDTNRLTRAVEALCDRVARIEAKAQPLAPDTLRDAVLAEFNVATLRLARVSDDIRTLHPATYEAETRAAWERIAKRLSTETQGTP